MDMEISCMQMIFHSGNSRGDSSEAIECLKEKQFDKATELLENAELLRTMTNDEAIPMNLLLVHAEDHVASSEVVLTMANELFVVYSILNEGKVY